MTDNDGSKKHWASAGMIIGIILVIIAYTLALVSEATQDTVVSASYIAGGLEAILYIVALPLIYFAGRSARKALDTPGDPGLRLASWIIYGVSQANAVLFFRWGLIAGGDNREPDSQITANSIALFITTMLMVADTYKSYKRLNQHSQQRR